MVIRKLLAEDLEFLLEVRNHPTTRVQLGNDNVFTLEECKDWFDNLGSPWYIIEVDDRRVGYIRTDENTVGIDIHIDERNKGYATQAYQEFLKDKTEYYLWVFDTNEVGKHIYEKLEFKYTGKSKTIRNQLYLEMKWKKS
jgi:hypothetical protein